MIPHHIESCRLCKSTKLKNILKLNDSPLCDAYVPVVKKQDFYPLGLMKCLKCDFVQLSYVVPPEMIYLDYIYITSSSMGLREHFKGYAKEILKVIKLKKNRLFLDIGSNDGTLLQEFKEFGFKVIGVEPAKDIAEEATNNGILTYPNFFDDEVVNKIKNEHGKVDIITINNLFANIVDLNTFLKNLTDIISEKGILIVESSYLYDMVNNNVFDFIYHEHLSYFSLKPLQNWFNSYGMEIFNIQKVNTKGGSLRYFISRKGIYKKEEIVGNINSFEKEGIELENLFRSFQSEINENRSILHNMIEDYENKTIVAYGASATSTTLITHFNLDKKIDYFVDDNPGKINTYSPGFNIKVESKEMLLKKKPDLIIIFAWRYYEQIMKNIDHINVDVILPLPKPKFLKKKTNAF